MNQQGIYIHIDLTLSNFKLAVSLNLPAEGVTAIFGHSGSGKTTLLRCLAGLEKAPVATISINERVWQSTSVFVPTAKRQLGYVFQEPSLFPHLSVLKNLAFGQALPDTEEIEVVAQQLGIHHLLSRTSHHLSGGERQRVAIARTLLTKPSVLLMDEPLAALDLKRKHEILPFLEKLRHELKIPIIYVTHSPDEVARLADHLVLMKNGQVIASGCLNEVLCHADLHDFFGDSTGIVVEGVVHEHDEQDHLSNIQFPGGNLWVIKQTAHVGQSIRCRILASDVSLSLEKTPSSILNAIHGSITRITDTSKPGQILVEIQAGPTKLLSFITSRSCRQLSLHTGKPIWAQIKSVAVLK